MALAVVGGAFLGAVFNVLLERIASLEIKAFFKTKKLNHKLLQRLKIKLLSVHGVLEDAEGKQFRNAAVKEWLDELKDAAFAADDLFDEIHTEAKITANEVHSSNSASVNSLDKEFEQKIEEILERLECLVEEKHVLPLQEGVGTKWSSKAPKTSLLEESGVYGRDNDKEAIIELLLSEDPNKRISVIPIVGMGGIGKTTLAQLVYNDERVKDKFQLKAWVCVSEEFDAVRVTKVILEAITSSASNTNDLNSLQVELEKKLHGKKFLVVLDDVWNESYNEWRHLQSPFQNGAQGSKVIVTTRSSRVAQIMQTVQPHHLDHLSDEDCWSLFARHAFDYEGSSKPILKEIGRKIVRKCKGLPLAAKTLGGLLRSNHDIKTWAEVLNSDIWDFSDYESNIIPSLRLSYYYLPSHLKQCFAFCSIFPKDYEFKKSHLILLWMAENLLQQPKANKRIEEVGEEYFHELVSRSFFEESSSYKRRYVMHDLINDLARCVSGKFCNRLENEDSYKIVETRTRRLSLVFGHEFRSVNFEAFYKANHMRTLLTLGDWNYESKELKLQETFSKLSCLRVLSLVGFSQLEGLPNSVCFLRHLRYLDVSNTKVKWLHESICNLYNLQTLKARYCEHLTRLPEGLHKLINLRYLDIHGCSNLEEMPSGIGKLTSLQKLSDFIVGEKYGCSISEVGQLVYLRGSLYFHNLQYVVSVEDAKEAKLSSKEYLHQLYLDWSYSPGTDTNDSRREKEILDNLQPHTRSLELLAIYSYMGTVFPKWLGDPSFCNLVSVSLDGCKYCCVLPPLGQLPSLKDLVLSDFQGVVSVGPEFYGILSCAANVIQPFASLKSLMFYSMGAWEKWCHVVGNESCRAFPHLQKLHIEDCPRLTGDLPSNLPFLIELEIENCPNLEFPVNANADQCYQSLKLLQIKDSCNSLRSFPLDHFLNLKHLSFENCVNLESLTGSFPEGEGDRPSKQFKPVIIRCPKFSSLNLTSFVIHDYI